jgi:hypothetical protein
MSWDRVGTSRGEHEFCSLTVSKRSLSVCLDLNQPLFYNGIAVQTPSLFLLGLTGLVSVGLASMQVKGEPPPLNPHANLTPPEPASTPPLLPRLGGSNAAAPARKPQPAEESARTGAKPIPAPPPQPAAAVPAPPILPAVVLPGARSASDIQRFTPAVEVWRANAHAPQVPPRRRHYVAEAYVSDSNPVLVRLQFDRAARGNLVFVRPGRDAILDSNPENLRINGAGECLVTLHLAEGADSGHVAFHCAGLMTTVSLTRTSEARVQARENAGGNR